MSHWCQALSLFLMTLTALRGTGQEFCRLSPVGIFLMSFSSLDKGYVSSAKKITSHQDSMLSA
jgi:hypothetical protein